MAKVLGLQCIRCAATYPADHYAADCAACRPVARSNLTVVYDETLRVRRDKPAAGANRGLWRYGDVLPVDASKAVSLGEGNSPLHHLTRVGAEFDLSNLYVKYDKLNPTF
jgi:threonine synthase